jgi:transposase-like protein
LPVAEICRHHGISDATYSTWLSRFDSMKGSDACRLKALDEVNRKLMEALRRFGARGGRAARGVEKKRLTLSARRTTVS